MAAIIEEQTKKDQVQAPQPPDPVARGETYRRIMIMGDNDNLNDVFWQVNGVELNIRRNESVIVPQSYLDIMRQNKSPRYFNVAGMGTYETAEVCTMQISDDGEASEREFQAMLAEGRLISRSQLPIITPMQRVLQKQAQLNL